MMTATCGHKIKDSWFSNPISKVDVINSINESGELEIYSKVLCPNCWKQYNYYDLIIYDISLIPKGIYCYISLGINYDKDGRSIMKTKVCPYWEFIEENIGYCHYLKRGDFSENGSGLLFDQVKECGVNDEGNDY